MFQSPYIGQNSGGFFSDFQISGQSLINESCLNSRTSNDPDMKLVSVTKLDKRNTAILKNFYEMSCMQMVTSLSFFQFTAN